MTAANVVKKPRNKSEGRFVSEIGRLTQEIKNLENQKYFRIAQDKSKLFSHSLFIGFAQGLGAVLGATVGISILIFILNKLSLLPFVGDMAERIINLIKK